MNTVYRFAGVTLTADSIAQAQRQLADNARLCAAVALDYRNCGPLVEHGFYVNDVESYRVQCEQTAQEHEAGRWNHTVAFMQLAHYLQTGESVALLP